MQNSKNAEILISEKTLFDIQVPYKVIESGQKAKEKPLILYLHGFNDNIERFMKTCDSLITRIEAYHLFIQAPYPVYDRSKERKVEDWGRAWYLYDGEQDQFIRSLEKASVLLEEILMLVKNKISVERYCILGYSMGGYLAGYFAMTRFKLINELIVTGARIKTEVLNNKWSSIKYLQILAIHGKRDKLVDYKPQRTEIKRLLKNGVNADFKLIDQKHIFNKDYMKEIWDWLFKKGYDRSNC